ncbi:MAG: hypothetical protein KDA25_01080 [Phycisphaerales bacterium]|nr:hypothetical protein [Phycisphaerales bacterium]
MTEHADDHPTVPLTDRAVTRMLTLGLSRPARPIDGLIERLSAPDAAGWLDVALRLSPAASDGDPVDRLVHGQASRADLEVYKRSAQASNAPPISDEAMRGMFAYFTIVAAGLAHHGILLTSRPREQVDEFLLDLAAVLPEPWHSFLCRATEAPA